MERPWGGRRLETELHLSLPATVPIGELWGISDRPEAQSIVCDGPFQGTSMHELWTEQRAEIFGTNHLANPSPKFPLLCKLLDAAEPLSLQVHPRAAEAVLLHGEPKTECWYFLNAQPGAFCYAGLRKGVTQEAFEKALNEGTLEPLLHTIPIKSGESLFIPSGRLHAIGKGVLLVEIQQNSDTTYRVFDWNRRDLQGNLRTLHIKEALASIDFTDYEPTLKDTSKAPVADSDFFHVEKWILDAPRLAVEPNDFALFTCLTGNVTCGDQTYHPGDFFLVPTSMQGVLLLPQTVHTSVLCTHLPTSKSSVL